MIACNESEWTNFGDTFKNAYSLFGMDTMLCPDSSYNIAVRGHEALTRYDTLELRVKRCVGVGCASGAVIDNYLNTEVNTVDYIRTRFLLVDTVVRGQSSTPVITSLRRNINLDFAPQSGIRVNVYLGKFSFTTDTSIFPWTMASE